MDAQGTIKTILTDNDITYQWLADRIGSSRQQVHYLLNTAKDIPTQTYLDMMKVFEKHGYMPASSAVCDSIASKALQTNSNLNNDMKSLNDMVIDIIADKKITAEERMRITELINTIKEATIKQYDEILTVINGASR